MACNQMHGTRQPPADAQRQHHVTQLADRRIGQHTLDIGGRNGNRGRHEQSDDADHSDHADQVPITAMDRSAGRRESSQRRNIELRPFE